MTAAVGFSRSAASVADVRRLVCQEANVDLSHPAVLVASELATNAVRYTPGPFMVTVENTDRLIRIEVTDHAPELMPPEKGASSGERGHGLTIVATLSEAWGTDVNGDGTKAVWAAVVA